MASSRAAAREEPLEQRILLTATLCLLAAGAVMVYSASSARTLLQGQGDGTGYLVKYVAYGAVGLVVMRVLARTPLETVRQLTGPLLGFSFLALVAVKVPHVGVEVNGARRWLGAGPLQFQPSELMKLALVLYAARLLADKPHKVRSLRGVLSPLVYVAGAACLLVASQPDLGTALIIGFTLASVLVAAGMPVRYLVLCALVAFVLVALFAIVEPYRRTRLTIFLDPWAHASGAGFQSVQGQIALGSGGVFGRGLGASVQKIFFLPEAHTDFILAVIGEELGIAGVWGLLFLYGLVAYGGLRAARRARGRYAALVAVGVTSLVLSQALLNVFAVLGLAPLTGVPLPFISSGSSSVLVLLAGMGVLLNVAGGGHAHLRAVRRRAARDDVAASAPRDAQGSPRGDAGAHRGRRDGGARRARAGGRRRAAS